MKKHISYNKVITWIKTFGWIIQQCGEGYIRDTIRHCITVHYCRLMCHGIIPTFLTAYISHSVSLPPSLSRSLALPLSLPLSVSLRYRLKCHEVCPAYSCVRHDVTLIREVKESACRHVAVSTASSERLSSSSVITGLVTMVLTLCLTLVFCTSLIHTQSLELFNFTKEDALTCSQVWSFLLFLLNN